MSESEALAIGLEKLAEVEDLVKRLSEAEAMLESGYAKLGFLLEEVAEARHWMGSYDSFGDFLTHISETFNIGKSQLYNYRSAVRDLRGAVSEAQLDQMGISKALALRGTQNATGTIPENVLTAALDPKVTVKDVKKLLFEASHMATPEQGTWRDADASCYFTDEEWNIVNTAANAARHIDPPVDEKLPAFMQRKEILIRIAQEFLAAYADKVVDGGRGL
jgi:hypothetical protein